MYPEAPIYTAFRVKGSICDKEFADRKIIESKWSLLIKYGKLYSPLRFLLPWIWGSLDLSGYGVVITSCSGYIARGFKVSPKTKVVAIATHRQNFCMVIRRVLNGRNTGW